MFAKRMEKVSEKLKMLGGENCKNFG